CDCSSCSELKASPSPAFTACGGEPFGLWISDDKVDADVSVSLGAKCPVDVTAIKPPASGHVLLLDLESGGSGALSLTPPEIDFAVGKQCLGIDPVGGSCGSLTSKNGTLSCTDDACGHCTCTSMTSVARFGSLGNLLASWKRTDSQLVVSEGNSTFTASYC